MYECLVDAVDEKIAYERHTVSVYFVLAPFELHEYTGFPGKLAVIFLSSFTSCFGVVIGRGKDTAIQLFTCIFKEVVSTWIKTVTF